MSQPAMRLLCRRQAYHFQEASPMRAAKYWGDGLAAAWRRKELDGKGPVWNIMLDEMTAATVLPDDAV